MEFALVLPALALLLLGIFGYGQYFLLAHSAQQIANNAARATTAGLSLAERTSLATAAVAREVAELPNAQANTYSVAVSENATTKMVTVRVRLDASANDLLRMSFVPMPSPVIERLSMMRQGGVE